MTTKNFSFPKRHHGPMAITKVTVIPMDRQRTLADQTVVVEDGQIKAVEPAGNIDTTNMQTVDGTGKYLLPGLADMHIHYWMPGDASLFLANGVTTVRNMSGAPFHLALQKKVDNGESPGPRIVTTCPTLEADEHNLPMWKYLDNPADAIRLVQQYAERGYHQIKVLNMLSVDVMAALGKACQVHNLRLTGHCPQATTYEEAIDLGMTCFEHLHGIWKGHLRPGFAPDTNSNVGLEAIEAMANHLDYEAIRRLAGQMAEQQIWNCPTLTVEQLMRLPQSEGLAYLERESMLQYVPQIALPLWEMLEPARFHGDHLAQWLDAVKGRWQAALKVTQILHEEGAPLLIGTDTSVRFVMQGFSVHEELENFVRAGLTPYEAIRCATSEPARFLDIESESGTVTKGKRADLILVGENPLENVNALRQIEATFANGFYLDRPLLDTLLREQAQIAKQVPIELKPLPKKSTEVHTAPMISGTLLEMAGEIPKGKLHYRHQQLADGGWEIEESYAFEQNSIYDIGGYRLRSTKMQLDADLAVLKATVSEESFCGMASLEIQYTESNGYKVRQMGEDGFVSHYQINVPEPLLPDISLLVTMGICIGQEKVPAQTETRQTVHLLPSIELERIALGKSDIRIEQDAATNSKEIHVSSRCGTAKLDGVYQLRHDGQLESYKYGWSQFVLAAE